MCGISGFLTRDNITSNSDLSELAVSMSNAITSRGPDDSGVWVDGRAGIALSHRRLAVIDLSPAGHQPMMSASGRYIIVFNGEIYNHQEIRGELCDNMYHWNGHSDTETLLNAVEVWGVESTLKRCEGMFAFAVWDRKKSTLILARDRLGEKPLYYGWQGNSFLFASDLNALKKHPDFIWEIDRESLALLVQYNYIPAPHSIYSGIKKLLPGKMVSVSLDKQKLEQNYYWNFKESVESSIKDPFIGSFDEAVNELENILSNTISKQMFSDVPIGAFLSGGVDSSAIVALMQKVNQHPVKTFTIGFNEGVHNEAIYAKAVASHLGTDHTELYVTPQHALGVIPKLHQIYSEPFADSSQIPTFLVSELARQDVTVALSGDGGDELFAGYNRYIMSHKMWGGLSNIPLALRVNLSRLILSIKPDYFEVLNKVFSQNSSLANFGSKIHKGAGVIGAKSAEDLYSLLVSHWRDEHEVVIGMQHSVKHDRPTGLLEKEHFVHKMMMMDMQTYLPDDILCKVDRAAMANSLETRVPLLSHKIVEFAWKLPLEMKLNSGQGKRVLREVLYKYAPKKLIERPKTGFAIPIAEWLRGTLRNWAEELLDESRIVQDGFFNYEPIQKKWQEHLSGKKDWSSNLWSILMFQEWYEQNKK